MTETRIRLSNLANTDITTQGGGGANSKLIVTNNDGVIDESLLNTSYMPIAGGTFTGPITLKNDTYSGLGFGVKGALNCANSDIIGINGIYFNNVAKHGGEGINFFKSVGVYDSLWGANSELYWTVDRGVDSNSGTNTYNVITSKGGDFTGVLKFDYSSVAKTLGSTTYLPLAFTYQTTTGHVQTRYPFWYFPSLDTAGNNGYGIGISCGGYTVISGGEAGLNYVTNELVNGGSEQLALCSDNNVWVFTACQTYANKKQFQFSIDGNLIAPSFKFSTGALVPPMPSTRTYGTWARILVTTNTYTFPSGGSYAYFSIGMYGTPNILTETYSGIAAGGATITFSNTTTRIYGFYWKIT